jgi:hypothetical protein
MFLLHFDEAAKRGLLAESLDDLPKYTSIPPKDNSGTDES